MSSRGVFTESFREKFADLVGGNLASPIPIQMALAFFSVGEGGYSIVGSSRLPKAPSESRTDIEATITSTDPAGVSDTGAKFVKGLSSNDISVTNKDVTVSCVLDANEVDLDNHSHLTGNLNGDPRLFELGIYDGNPSTSPSTLMAYCTFDEIVKVSGRRVEIRLTIRF